ncbi:DUF2075 domain-containing protein [Ruminococcus albus]|uniref:Schlafen group 3-like DNA/RNA helicase domain-containing protein n=1 Tax=Ruminococcus albus TaxID=1264 RepID=A0A1H7PLR8_RUMAL|nr:DUF2075 domain-containing protein [Ruminococcus albus]SEL36007.1 hypothetical protein SAMN05216469_12225 [Ruminococcus albus]
MLIYSGTKQKFSEEVISDQIARRIDTLFWKHGLKHENEREYLSWKNSLVYMQRVLDTPSISDDVQIAIEYCIPQTALRVDFIIAGENADGKENVIIVELKQWQKAQRTHRNHIVKTYTGGMERDVPHPSYQAYSYAKTIESYSETAQEQHIFFHPCAYLHNYETIHRHEIDNDHYRDVLDAAPVYIKSDEDKLREFIQSYVTKPSKKDILYEIDNGRIRPTKSLQDALVSLIEGNEEYLMLDEQKMAYETILEIIRLGMTKDRKFTIIIEGGPGTGKSVIAIQLLAELVKRGLNAQYVTKNSAPREVYKEKLIQNNYGKGFVGNLMRSSVSYTNCKPNTFDCLIVDEAHRLGEGAFIFGRKGGNQIEEIIQASRINVFFIDENQIVTSADKGSISDIKQIAYKHHSIVYHDESINLKSQFRCNGSDGFISFLDSFLSLDGQASHYAFEDHYDFRVFDDPSEMRESLRKINAKRNAARLVAGYCYDWKSQNDPDSYDIILNQEKFKAQWNFKSTKTWAIDPYSFDQVGCIHTAQGLEFDYVGVIIGKDLVFKEGKVCTDSTQRAKSDFSLRGLRPNNPKCDMIIRNTYRTLMTRGQKGCFVYCEDRALSDYLKMLINANFQNSNQTPN